MHETSQLQTCLNTTFYLQGAQRITYINQTLQEDGSSRLQCVLKVCAYIVVGFLLSMQLRGVGKLESMCGCIIRKQKHVHKGDLWFLGDSLKSWI